MLPLLLLLLLLLGSSGAAVETLACGPCQWSEASQAYIRAVCTGDGGELKYYDR